MQPTDALNEELLNVYYARNRDRSADWSLLPVLLASLVSRMAYTGSALSQSRVLLFGGSIVSAISLAIG